MAPQERQLPPPAPPPPPMIWWCPWFTARTMLYLKVLIILHLSKYMSWTIKVQKTSHLHDQEDDPDDDARTGDQDNNRADHLLCLLPSTEQIQHNVVRIVPVPERSTRLWRLDSESEDTASNYSFYADLVKSDSISFYSWEAYWADQFHSQCRLGSNVSQWLLIYLLFVYFVHSSFAFRSKFTDVNGQIWTYDLNWQSND